MTSKDATQLTDEVRRKQRVIGRCLCFAGVLGMFFFIYRMPENYDSVFATARWASGTMISTILAFAGLPGMFAGSLRSPQLKVVDLIWVLGSAVAIVFAVVQVSQYSADETRSEISKNIEKARTSAKAEAAMAYQQQCAQPSNLTTKQCESLRHIGISLSVGGYLSSSAVESLCPPPINLSNPPHGFRAALIDTCISSAYVALAPEDPIMKDIANVKDWKSTTRLWPIFMIMLVSLRIMKSVAEVFWRVK